MLDAIKHITDDNYFFQEDSTLMHMHCACNTVQLLQRCLLLFSLNHTPNSPELNALVTRFSRQPGMEAPLHPCTCKPSPPVCRRCAYEQAASELHAG